MADIDPVVTKLRFDLDLYRQRRAEKFEARVNVDDDEDMGRMVVLRYTTNGPQEYCVSLYPEEWEQVILTLAVAISDMRKTEETGPLRTSCAWLDHPDYEGWVVLDPDGWDRKDFVRSWNQMITREEFTRRLERSTVIVSDKAGGL